MAVKKMKIGAIFFLMFFFSHHAFAEIYSVKSDDLANLKGARFIDASSFTSCLNRSLEGATCVPFETFLDEQGELSSFRDIQWALGTVSIGNEDSIFVFSKNIEDTYAIAGLFYLAGVRHVYVWEGEIERLFSSLHAGAGKTRSIVRETYFSNPIRIQHLIHSKNLNDKKYQNWLIANVESPIKSEKNTILIGNDMKKVFSNFASLIMNTRKSILLSVESMAVPFGRG